MAFYFWGFLALGTGSALVFSSQLEFLVPTVAGGSAMVVEAIGEHYITHLGKAASTGARVTFPLDLIDIGSVSHHVTKEST